MITAQEKAADLLGRKSPGLALESAGMRFLEATAKEDNTADGYWLEVSEIIQSQMTKDEADAAEAEAARLAELVKLADAADLDRAKAYAPRLKESHGKDALMKYAKESEKACRKENDLESARVWGLVISELTKLDQ